jgi:hypothetical protein
MSALPSPPLRRIVLTAVSTVAGGLLLLSLKPHTTASAAAPADGGSAPVAGPATPAPSGGSSGAPSGSPSASPSHSSGGGAGGSGASTTRTVDGDAVQTRYGPVQLRITLTGGKLTAVTAIQLPQDNPRDSEISGFAVPQLTQEALAAQSAHIDSVSGATYTSEGYVQSLQSALDKAGG